MLALRCRKVAMWESGEEGESAIGTGHWRSMLYLERAPLVGEGSLHLEDLARKV
jgi:hypothetical protein